MKIEDVARLCHETNVALCEAFGELTSGHWEDAPEWQRKSSIQGVKWRLENMDAPVSAQHEAWCKSKIDEGWQYGSIKNPEARTHPCLVRFDALPKEQQAKDYLFTAIVRACAPLID